jgi:hypothetical protein
MFGIDMVNRVSIPKSICHKLNIPFNTAMTLIAGLRSKDDEKVASVLIQIMQADINNLNTAPCLNILNDLCDLIKNERPKIERYVGKYFFVPDQIEHDPRNTLGSAALKILEVILEKMLDRGDKLAFLEQACNEPIFTQHFSVNPFHKVGRTGGQIAIDELIAQVKRGESCAIM